MNDPIKLNPSGPHTPEYTRQVADTLAEAVRVLIYATRSGAGGLRYPADAYSLLGALCTATGRLDQLLTQVAGFLEAQHRSGTLSDSQGRDPRELVERALYSLFLAREAAFNLTNSLQAAQNAISGLYVKESAERRGK
jgi:hypothetical protein